MTFMIKIPKILTLSFFALAFVASSSLAQNYDLDSLPTKNYQAYPQDIPDKKWVSLFFKASRKYGREGAESQGWNKRYYSSEVILKENGEVLGWIRNDDETEQNILVKTSLRNCQAANYTSFSGLFVEYWQGSNLRERMNYYSSYYYSSVHSLAIEGICEAAIAEYKKRI